MERTIPNMEPKPEFIPTRESLLSRLKDWNDDESWREFYDIYRRLIFSTAIKAGLTEQEAEEVVQETLISIAKTIKDFKYDPRECRFKSWLGHLTHKRIADSFRKRGRESLLREDSAEGTSKTPVMERIPDVSGVDLDAIWEDEWRQKVLEAAIGRVKNRVGAEQYQMFDFYVLKKMPVRKVAADLGTSVGRIYLAKHRVAKLIKKEVKALETRMG
jgi:RNA polymerase sigma factor (sigma-70 family)